MSRPEFSQVRRQHRVIASFVGETATWHKFASASAGAAPEYGIEGVACYAARTVTGLFRQVSLDEVGQAGGVLVAGDMRATLVDCIPSAEDEISWRGVRYRVVSDPVLQAIAGRTAYQMVLRRGR
jgi:hypothetical protein